MRHNQPTTKWCKILLYHGSYNEQLLKKQTTQYRQDPYLLVISMSHDDEVVVRYPDATTDRVPMSYIDTQHTLTPRDKQYWVDFTPAMEKQQFYNEAYNFVCEQYGFIRDNRYQHKFETQEPEVAEPYYADDTIHVKPWTKLPPANTKAVETVRLNAYKQIKDAMDILISLEH